MVNDERRGERYARLSELGDYHVSPEDPDPRGWTVVDGSGEPLGRVTDLIVDTDAMKVRYLDVEVSGSSIAGGRARIPVERVDVDGSAQRVIADVGREALAGFTGDYAAAGGTAADREAVGMAEQGHAFAGTDEEARLTRSEEEVRVGTRPVQAGEVVIGKHVETERVTTPVERRVERVRVERRPVAPGAAGAPELREGEIRVPVMEEEVVVEKRPIVKEEIVVTREAATETEQVETDVRREQVHVSGDQELIEEDQAARRQRAGGGGRG